MKTSKLLFNIAYISTVVIGMSLVILVVIAGIMEIWKYNTEYILKWMFTLLVLLVFMFFITGILLSKTEPKKVNDVPLEEVLNGEITLNKIRELVINKIEVNYRNKAKINIKMRSLGAERATELSTLDYKEFYNFLNNL